MCRKHAPSSARSSCVRDAGTLTNMVETESPAMPPKKPLRIGAVIAVALAVGVGAWLILRNDDNSNSPNAFQPVAASLTDLRATAAAAGHPVYWAGPLPGYTFELTRTGAGNIFVRYLPSGTSVGDPEARFLTVATYPLADGYSRLRGAARQQGTDEQRIANRGLVMVNRSRPSSVYLAYPGGKYQVEVFDRSPTRALKLVTSGRVRPIIEAPTP